MKKITRPVVVGGVLLAGIIVSAFFALRYLPDYLTTSRDANLSSETSIVILNLTEKRVVSSDQPFTLKWSVKNPPVDKENWKLNIGLKPSGSSTFAYLETLTFKSSDGSYTIKSLDGIYSKGTVLSLKVCLAQSNPLGKPITVKTYCGSAPGQIQVGVSKAQAQKIAELQTTNFSSWKLYKNEKYGFQFNYPPTGKWYVWDSIDTDVKGEGVVEIKRCPSDYCEILIKIGVYSKTVDQKVAEYKNYGMGRFTFEVQVADSDLVRLKTTGKKVIVNDSLTGGEARVIYVIADPRNANRSLTVDIDSNGYVLSPDEFVATINKITASIKFI